MSIADDLAQSIMELKMLLGENGNYSICRTDDSKMFLGDVLIVEDVLERIDLALEAYWKAQETK